MGGIILLLIITVVLCIVILCMRRCHRKGTFPVDNKVLYNTTNLNENVTIDNNPAYDVTKANTVGSLYSTIKRGDSDVLTHLTMFPLSPIAKPQVKMNIYSLIRTI